MNRFLFVSTMAAAPWGGSEALWSGAARALALSGNRVTASTQGWPEVPAQLMSLSGAGVLLETRNDPPELRSSAVRVARRLLRLGGTDEWASVRSHLTSTSVDMLVISCGAVLPNPGLRKLAIESGVRYVNICQANHEGLFIDDRDLESVTEYAERAAALYFVSRSNLELFETQLGKSVGNGHVVRNPLGFDSHAAISLEEPHATKDRGPRFACVGRLHAASKGQDILLRSLACPTWKAREWSLSFFGSGPNGKSLAKLAEALGLGDRVTFFGHVDDMLNVWKEHDALLLPSRYEGLPLAAVEAMMCARVVVTTPNGGAKEIVTDGATGFVSASSEVTHFQAALEAAWRARDEWPAIGMRARNAASERYLSDPCQSFADHLKRVLVS